MAAPKAINPVIFEILEMILKALEDCKAPEKKRVAIVRNPTRIQRLGLWARARAHGMKASVFNAGLKELEEIRDESSDPELKAILDQAKAA